MFKELFVESFKPSKSRDYVGKNGEPLFNWFVPKSRGLKFVTENGSVLKISGWDQRGYNVNIIDSPKKNLIGKSYKYTKHGTVHDERLADELKVVGVYNKQPQKVTKEEIEDWKAYLKAENPEGMHNATINANGLRKSPYRLFISFISLKDALSFRDTLKKSQYKDKTIHLLSMNTVAVIKENNV